MIVTLQRLDGSRPQPLSHEFIDRGQQQIAIVGEVLGRIAPAARVDDRGDVIVGKIALDELTRRFFHKRCSKRADVEIVEHEQNPPVARPAVDAHRADVRCGMTDLAARLKAD